jgi:hypothetical protein
MTADYDANAWHANPDLMVVVMVANSGVVMVMMVMVMGHRRPAAVVLDGLHISLAHALLCAGRAIRFHQFCRVMDRP